jgi:hypothetical protein
MGADEYYRLISPTVAATASCADLRLAQKLRQLHDIHRNPPRATISGTERNEVNPK